MIAKFHSSKTCRECGEEKPLSSFYAHNQMADGYLNKCKRCVLDRVSKHRVSNIDRIRKHDRERGRTDHHRNMVATSAEKAKLRDPVAYATRRSAASRIWALRNPEKKHATTVVNNALRDGRLIRGKCESCGTGDRVEGHHDDYSKPLQVRWLCAPCHGSHHAQMRDQARAVNGDL